MYRFPLENFLKQVCQPHADGVTSSAKADREFFYENLQITICTFYRYGAAEDVLESKK